MKSFFELFYCPGKFSGEKHVKKRNWNYFWHTAVLHCTISHLKPHPSSPISSYPLPPPSINSQPLPISPIYSCQFLPTLTNSPTSSASTHCHSLPPTLSSFDTLQFTLLLLNVLLYYSIHSKLLQSKIIYSLYYSCLPIHCIKSLPLRVNYNN